MEDEIVNKVASSGLITLDLEELYPEGDRALFDLKPFLFHELILKEKDFRAHIKSHDWSMYTSKFVAVTCSADAIIPTWAYMLVASALEPYARAVVFGDLQRLEETLFNTAIDMIDISKYIDQRVVIKGCSKKPVPDSAYVKVTALLRPVVKSMMFGEPCSTVPVYKRKD